MTDEQLKTLINKPFTIDNVQAGDYVRIKYLSSGAYGEIRKVIRVFNKTMRIAKHHSENGFIWDKYKLEPATREEYVAFMEGRGYPYD